GGGFAVQVGEIVAQQFGGAAGVGIFRREDDDRIDRQAQLHQVAIATMQEIGREPRLLARLLADRHHLVDRRHVAERQYVIERRMAAGLTAFDRNASAGAGGARDFRGAQDLGLPGGCGVRFWAQDRHCASTSRGSALGPAQAARAAYSPGWRVSKCRDSAARCRPPARGRRPDRSRGRYAPRSAAPDRQWRLPPWYRRDKCRDARPSLAPP